MMPHGLQDRCGGGRWFRGGGVRGWVGGGALVDHPWGGGLSRHRGRIASDLDCHGSARLD